MRKTSKTARITILLLVLCLISTAMLSGTFARYTSEYAGADTALIAKWDISVSDGDEHGFTMLPGEAQQLDLFKHAYDTNILSTAGDSKIIAPGVNGEFVLKVANNGDVAAKMTFDFKVSGTADTVPIKYKLKDVEGQTWGDLVALKAALNELEKMKNVAPGTGSAAQIVEWRWPFERGGDAAAIAANNKEDTDLGTDSVTDNRSTYILTITATAEQIAPATE
jgi:hypothetical protein